MPHLRLMASEMHIRVCGVSCGREEAPIPTRCPLSSHTLGGEHVFLEICDRSIFPSPETGVALDATCAPCRLN